MTQQQVIDCFNLVKQKRKLPEIVDIIEGFRKIVPPTLEPISKLNQTLTSNISYENNSFVPAPDLLKSYQQTFTKANQEEKIVNTTNYKLKANFSQSGPKRNFMENIGSYYKGEQAVMIEDREETILKQLQEGRIETTIPNMEKTLFHNELSNLEQKNIAMENTLPLSEWKKLRAKMNPSKTAK